MKLGQSVLKNITNRWELYRNVQCFGKLEITLLTAYRKNVMIEPESGIHTYSLDISFLNIQALKIWNLYRIVLLMIKVKIHCVSVNIGLGSLK